MRAKQGFYTEHCLTVRLRGINAPELKGDTYDAGLKTKEYLEQRLLDLNFVMIKTFKTDSFGRYVVDLLYHPVWEDPDRVFLEGFYLNQELVDEGLVKLAAY